MGKRRYKEPKLTGDELLAEAKLMMERAHFYANQKADWNRSGWQGERAKQLWGTYKDRKTLYDKMVEGWYG